MILLKAIGYGLTGALLLAGLSIYGADKLITGAKPALSAMFALVPMALIAGFLLGISATIAAPSIARPRLWFAAAVLYAIGCVWGFFEAGLHKRTYYQITRQAALQKQEMVNGK